MSTIDVNTTIVRDSSGAFRFAIVNRSERTPEGREYDLGQASLTDLETASAFERAIVGLNDQIAAITAERDAALASVGPLQAEIDRLTSLIPPPVDPNAVPEVITRTQARLVLHRAGLLDTVLQIIAAGGIEAQIWYEANEWHRSSPVLASMSQALGFTDEQVDNLFRAAGAIVP